ncbi:MAG: carbon-nitrogen hydrolase family protein [Bryobacterales bacterium]|nr:carbon-nitrogen hydrolase family protein [Bryobacterales bacterium]
MKTTLLAAACFSAVCAAGEPSRTPPAATRNRIVRVVTISQDLLGKTNPDLLEATMKRLDESAAFGPDIACLPELFARGAPESVPGPVTRRLAGWAREHSAYVVFGLKTRAGERVYNSAILLDRQGRVIGQYNKIHPTEGELKEGTRPGDADPPVFETDFGTIGIQICFDVNWWDFWKRLKAKGAKIVFFPAAFPADRQLSALALMNQCYIVSSSNSRSSRIYDITGEAVAASGNYRQWAGAAIPIGKRLFEVDYHTAKAREIQRKYGPKVELTWYHEDDWFTLASVDPTLTVEDLMAEFGLTPLDAYRIRAGQAIEAAR